jgi:hypothetical protein
MNNEGATTVFRNTLFLTCADSSYCPNMAHSTWLTHTMTCAANAAPCIACAGGLVLFPVDINVGDVEEDDDDGQKWCIEPHHQLVRTELLAHAAAPHAYERPDCGRQDSRGPHLKTNTP